MVITNQSTVIAVFQEIGQAEDAVTELRREGFRENQIGLATRDRGPGSAEVTENQDAPGARDKIVGPTLGAGLGALMGAGVVALNLPLVGPILAGGTIAVMLGNAAAGGAFVGIFSSLIDTGITEAEAQMYEEELAAGHTLVTVQADDRGREVLTILARYGGYEFNRPLGPSVSGAGSCEEVGNVRSG